MKNCISLAVILFLMACAIGGVSQVADKADLAVKNESLQRQLATAQRENAQLRQQVADLFKQIAQRDEMAAMQTLEILDAAAKIKADAEAKKNADAKPKEAPNGKTPAKPGTN